MMKKEKFDYHIFPPFVDAYMNSFYTEEQKTIEDIKEMMVMHCFHWADKVMGGCISRGRSLPKHNGKLVLCCAYTYKGYESYKQYLMILDKEGDDWYDHLKMVEGEVLKEWDVT